MTDPLLAIPQLLFRYARALDRLDMALLDRVFWSDAEVELGSIYRGDPAGFVAVAQGFMGSMAATRHCISNVLVEADGDQAGVEAHVDAWHRIEMPEGTRVLQVAGRYLSRAERRGGEWRLSAHAEVMDWAEERAADPGWFEGNAELPKGRRDGEDPSYGVLGR
jgi:hypothetical protein